MITEDINKTDQKEELFEAESILFDIGNEDFIKNEINSQIENIFNTDKRNYIEFYLEKYKFLKKFYEEEGNDEKLEDIKNNKIDFLFSMIEKISETFNIEYSEEDLTKKMVKSLYNFFIVNYVDNLQSMFLNIIRVNKKTIIKELKNQKPKRDVGSIANRAKFNPNDAIIINNIQEILTDLIPNMGIDNKFIDYIINYDDSLDNQNIKKLITKEKISINDFNAFIEPFIDQHDGYSIIISNIIIELSKSLNDIDILK